MSNEEKHNKKESMRNNLIQRQGEAKVVRKIVSLTAIILVITVGIIAAGGYFYLNSALKPVDPKDQTEKSVEIPIGSSVSGIGQVLEDNGIIKDARVFKYYVKLRNESGFMAGTYNLKPSMTMGEITESLKTGNIEQEVVFKITVPEGKQLQQIAGIIGEKTGQSGEEVFDQLNDEKFIKSMIKKYPSILTEEILAEDILNPLEGYLFPATYDYFTEEPTVEEVVTPMLDKTNAVIKEFSAEMEAQDYTPHTLLTMASLIEEEATAQVDRDQIASVFFNRLDIDMPLQTDPTVLYAHGEHKSRTLYEDLKIDSPYNTYKYNGLTPGPIANAGVTSIEATLYPAETEFLYFLATPSGEVLFSKTLDEHNVKKNEHITNQ
ncbi:endolytic transglycosylase MltG [Cytobacillus purgationiresistens]|uniref:Endolytic murein transglycosylase n=1 Tax=Cytobacillus purgationiresistens TaxID=863449 RepID=A0ABU0AE80_9BACI|nr:endolytic transglycosylase MltG [Cytobacillus purgationiresistens]MDQ0269552.1 UPF0755 protein [Cytobacillus purgationiresistens]